MTRVKSTASRKHRQLLSSVKGHRQSRRRRIKVAMDSALHAGQYAYHGRKLKKRDLRKLWIIRINAAVRTFGLSYSRFVALTKKAKVEIDRKILSDIAVKDPDTFKKIISILK